MSHNRNNEFTSKNEQRGEITTVEAALLTRQEFSTFMKLRKGTNFQDNKGAKMLHNFSPTNIQRAHCVNVLRWNGNVGYFRDRVALVTQKVVAPLD